MPIPETIERPGARGGLLQIDTELGRLLAGAMRARRRRRRA